MTELEYYKAFIDWLGEQGVVTEAHIKQFDSQLFATDEATKIVNQLFKGMF